MHYLIATHILAFLIGGIPFGYLIARSKGVDIREQGSGNIGATNVSRALGKNSGILTLLADVLKGLTCALLCYLLPNNGIVLEPNSFAASLGLFGILGHCYSPFLKFKGGKGVATSLGVFLIIAPVSALIAIGMFALVFKFSKYVSLASVIAAVSIPLTYGVLLSGTANGFTMTIAVVTAALITSRHKENLIRLKEGTEGKFERNSEPLGEELATN